MQGKPHLQSNRIVVKGGLEVIEEPDDPKTKYFIFVADVYQKADKVKRVSPKMPSFWIIQMRKMLDWTW